MTRTRWSPALLTMALAVSCGSAWAEPNRAVEKRYSRDYASCMDSGDAAQGVTSGIMDCNGAEIAGQDARLNQAYKMVMQRLPAARRDALRGSEKAWIKARDAGCKKQSAEEEGGTLAAVIYSGCILDETAKRTMFLESYH